MDEIVMQFTGITGATPQVARHYLQLTDGAIEQAVQLFFDSPELSATMNQEPSAPEQHSRANARSNTRNQPDSDGVIHIDSDDDPMDEDDDDISATQAGGPTDAAYEDDEAMARRMQEELYAGGDMTGDFDANGVRAPLARTTETLVGPQSNFPGDDAHDALLQQMRMRATQSRAGRAAVHYDETNRSANDPTVGRPGVFNQHSTAAVWNEEGSSSRQGLSRATGGQSDISTKAGLLAEMYRPPFELMTRLAWDDARDKGKEEEKWILVNVQDASIFDCQLLNRDIWKNDQIKETIKENFLFMQYSKDDPRGDQYMNYYFQSRDNQSAYPHIAIVDPRTGEQVKVWSGPPVPKAMDFVMQLHEFLDRYSLNPAVKNPVARRKAENDKSMDVDKLTEDEMLELALQNSMTAGSSSGPKVHDPDDLTKSVGDLSKGKEKESESSATQAAAATPFMQISSSKPHTEAEGPSTTRIQFRHSNGRVIRRFDLSDPVRRIYEWLKADALEGREGVEFELKSMGKDLIESLDMTVEEAGLKNGTVMVEFIEE